MIKASKGSSANGRKISRDLANTPRCPSGVTKGPSETGGIAGSWPGCFFGREGLGSVTSLGTSTGGGKETSATPCPESKGVDGSCRPASGGGWEGGPALPDSEAEPEDASLDGSKGDGPDSSLISSGESKDFSFSKRRSAGSASGGVKGEAGEESFCSSSFEAKTASSLGCPKDRGPEMVFARRSGRGRKGLSLRLLISRRLLFRL